MILFYSCFALSSLAGGVCGGSASLGLSKDFVFMVWDVGFQVGKLSSFFKKLLIIAFFFVRHMRL